MFTVSQTILLWFCFGLEKLNIILIQTESSKTFKPIKVWQSFCFRRFKCNISVNFLVSLKTKPRSRWASLQHQVLEFPCFHLQFSIFTFTACFCLRVNESRSDEFINESMLFYELWTFIKRLRNSREHIIIIIFIKLFVETNSKITRTS